jgi:hypothetical protein
MILDECRGSKGHVCVVSVDNHPWQDCVGFLCLPPQLTLTPQHKYLMLELMVHTVCSNEVNDGQHVCFLCDSGTIEDDKAEDKVQSPSAVERTSESLQLAIQRARATKRPATALTGNGDLVDAATTTKVASCSLSLAIDHESMATPLTKKKRKEKKMDDEVMPTTTSRFKVRLPRTKMKKGSRVKMQRNMLYHLCSVVQRRKSWRCCKYIQHTWYCDEWQFVKGLVC